MGRGQSADVDRPTRRSKSGVAVWVQINRDAVPDIKSADAMSMDMKGAKCNLWSHVPYSLSRFRMDFCC